MLTQPHPRFNKDRGWVVRSAGALNLNERADGGIAAIFGRDNDEDPRRIEIRLFGGRSLSPITVSQPPEPGVEIPGNFNLH